MNIFGPNIEKMAEEHDYDGLYRALTHRDMIVRLQAAQALADMDDGTGWRFLMETVQQPGDVEARTIAAAMLGELGHPRAVPVLGEELMKLRFAPVSDEFAEALHKALETINTPEAEEALRKAGYEPVLPVQHHTVIEYDAHYVRPVLHQTEEIKFRTAEEHLNSAVELREAEMTERGLVENSIALWLSPAWGYAWYIRGVLFEDLDRNYEAILAYRQTVELDPTQTDAKEALEELLREDPPKTEDADQFILDLGSRSWEDRRNAAAGLGDLALRGDPRPGEVVDALIKLLGDEEREVRHAAITTLGLLDNHRALLPLQTLEESSWLVRFAILETLSQLGSVEGLITALRSEMDLIQQRNPVFSTQKDPLLEVEYETLMEVGVRALEKTGDVEALLGIAEGNAWEETDEEEEAFEDDSTTGGESYYLPGNEEADEEAEEDLTSYVDEVAQMAVTALERLAIPKLPKLDDELLQRLAGVPDLTLIDLSQEQAEPVIVKDLSALRQAAQAEINRRG